jgi:hypothetical protein
VSNLRGRLTFANVVSMVALFVALGGSSYAAVTITGKQIKDGSITTKDIKDRSLLNRDFKPGQLPRGGTGPQGSAGAAGGAGGTRAGTNGANGQDGGTGPRGPSDAYVSGNVGPQSNSNSASVTVPAGDYVAAASGQVLYFRDDSTFPGSEGEANCSLTSAGDAAHNTGTFATVPSHGFWGGTQRGGAATVSQNSAFHLASGGTITYTCSNAALGMQDGAATMQYSNMRVTAIQVGALH